MQSHATYGPLCRSLYCGFPIGSRPAPIDSAATRSRMVPERQLWTRPEAFDGGG